MRSPTYSSKSITYFDDMDVAAWPNMIREKDLSAEKLKKELISRSEEYFKSHADPNPGPVSVRST